MKKTFLVLTSFFIITLVVFGQSKSKFDIKVITEFNVGEPIGKLRSVPVSLGKDVDPGILLVYSQDKEVDPFNEMFFFPKHCLVLAMYNALGVQLWKNVLSEGMIPGVWFCPVFPFDLNSDGVDEIYLTHNSNTEHPLSISGYKLEQLNSLTGKSEMLWPWTPPETSQSNSHLYRNFIFGGYANGVPILLTAQGTYGPMKIQAWNSDMTLRWNLAIPKGNTAKGSHMCSVFDLEGDKKDEFMWGERCIGIDDGRVKFIADSGLWQGHTDVVQPVFNKTDNRWYIYTCRESSATDSTMPRVVMYDDKGKRVWKDLVNGHMDMGWCANLGPKGESYSYALKIGQKVAGEKGFFRTGNEEFAYKTFTGEPVKFPFSLLGTLPVDFNGDGIHELVCANGEQADYKIYTGSGSIIGNVGEGGILSMASKFCNKDGEQVLVYYPDGTIRIFADINAKDNKAAKERYQSDFYKRNIKLTATGYNLGNLGGL